MSTSPHPVYVLARPVSNPREPLEFTDASLNPPGYILRSGGQNYEDRSAFSTKATLLCSDAILEGPFDLNQVVPAIQFDGYSLINVRPYALLSKGVYRCAVEYRTVPHVPASTTV